MSWVADTTKDLLGGLTGKTAAEGSLGAADIQSTSALEAAERFEPFRQLGLTGIDQASFLTDPNQQFNFLQNNPLFDLSLQNANTQTQNMAAARGRLSAGDTLQQLSNNVLLQSQPLIESQKQSIGNLLNIGVGGTTSQTGLTTDAAAAQAAGLVGAGNVQTQASQNLLSAGLLAGGIFGG